MLFKFASAPHTTLPNNKRGQDLTVEIGGLSHGYSSLRRQNLYLQALIDGGLEGDHAPQPVT